MAPFNPGVNPTNDPSYTRDSRAIDVPNNIRPTGVEQNQIMPHGVKEGDRSAEYIGKAKEYGLNADAVGLTAAGAASRSFADLFGSIVQAGDFVVKATDTLFKKNIENEIYKRADQEQGENIQALELIKNGPGGQKSFLDANAQMTDGLPEELEGLADTVGSLQGAASANKISNTMYYGRLLSIAKDMRARYPGYREYIDNTIAKATGVNPANAYLNQLVGDINRNMTAGSRETNKTLQYITQNQDLFGDKIKASQVYEAVRQGKMGMPEVMDLVRPAIVAKAKYDQDKRDFDTFKGRDEELKRKAINLYQTDVTRQTYATVQGLLVPLNADTKIGMIDFLRNAKQGAYTTPQLEEVASYLENVKLPEIIDKANQMSMQKFPESGRSIVGTIGPTMRNELAQAAAEDLKVIIRGLKSGKEGIGLAFDTINHMQAEMRDFNKQVYSDPKIAPRMRLFGAIDKFGGGQAAIGALMTDSILNGWDKDLTNFANDYVKQFATNAQKDADSEYTGLNDMLKSAKKQQVPQHVQDHIVESTTKLLTQAGVDPAMRANVAQALYGRASLGFVENMPPDGRDSNGNPVSGTYIRWSQMTRPEALEAMTSLKKQYPQAYNTYVNWVQVTSRNLFQREVQALSTVKDDPSLQFGFSVKDNKFWVAPTLATGRQSQSQQRELIAGRSITSDSYKAAQRAVARINQGLEPIIAIAQKEGKKPEDVTSYVIEKYTEMGGKVDLQTQGLPSRMYKELINAASNFERNENRDKKDADRYTNPVSEFTPSMRSGSMQDFVRDPFGTRGREGPLGSPEKTVQEIQQQEATTPAPKKERTSELPKPSQRPSSRPIRDRYGDAFKDVVATEVIDIPPGVDPKEYLREYDARKGR